MIRAVRALSMRVAGSAMLVLGLAQCAKAPAPGTLTPTAGRITDEAISRDMALMRAWAARIARVESEGAPSPARAYRASKARAWLSFASDEYQDNDRGGIVDDAFAAATASIASLERGSVTEGEVPLPRQVKRVHPELWDAVTRFKAHPRFDLVAADVALLEVTLVRAGHAGAPGAACSAAPFDAKADSLAKHIEYVLRSAPPPVVTPPVVTPPVPAPVIPAPADRDRDGVPDQFDCCPNTPVGEAVDANGCERLPAENVPLILDGLTFDTDKSVIKPESRARLDRVASVLVARSDILVEISGHTDAVASDAYNLRLSAARAAAVRAYLISRGVAAARITSVGEGETRPIDDNATVEGRARNRRVELVWHRPERTAPGEPGCKVPADTLAPISPLAPIMPPAESATPLVLMGVNFAFGSSRLTADSRETLDRVAAGLQLNPGVAVVIAGHTDSIGIAAANRELSLARARAVRAFLASQGVDTIRMVARGYGADEPLGTNATAEGRALNRRVELRRREIDDTVSGIILPTTRTPVRQPAPQPVTPQPVTPQPAPPPVARPLPGAPVRPAVPSIAPNLSEVPRRGPPSGFTDLPACQPPNYDDAPCSMEVPFGGGLSLPGPGSVNGKPVLSARTKAILDGVAVWMMWTWVDFVEIRSPSAAWNEEVHRYLLQRGAESWRVLRSVQPVREDADRRVQLLRRRYAPSQQWD